jgi:Leucine-rich repeat (LRR) protein
LNPLLRYLETEITDLDLPEVNQILIPSRYSCEARPDGEQNPDMNNIVKMTSVHVPGNTNFDVKGITFQDCNMKIIVNDIGKHLPNLMSVIADHSGLEKINERDLRQFPQMTFFSAAGNHIKLLFNDLFTNNPLLKTVNLSENEITIVGPNIISDLQQIKFILLAKNPCIKKNFHVEHNTSAFENYIRAVCPMEYDDNEVKKKSNDSDENLDD